MKRRTVRLIGLATIIALGGLVTKAVLGGEMAGATTSLQYQDNVNVQFEFQPKLVVQVSGDLQIDGLSPGMAKDSNVIDVNVATNVGYGYTLSATVGTSSGNTKLTNINPLLSGYYFDSATTNRSTLSDIGVVDEDTRKNEWAYSYSVDKGVTWISGSQGSTVTGYNGLPLDGNSSNTQLGKSGVILVDTDDAADSMDVKFKIAAYALNTQAAGTYTNTVNFYAVAKAAPTSFADIFEAAGATKHNGFYAMQDMTSAICSAVETIDEESQTQLIDVRDGSVYWVAKLQDGHCWMTQNLDLNLDSSVALTSEDTDLVQYGSGGYTANYTCSNQDTTTNCTANGEVISWTPERNTINAITTESTTKASLPEYEDDANTPYSVDPGEWYWYGQYYASENCPSNSGNNYLGCNYMTKPSGNNWSTYFKTQSFVANREHGSVGNYYNWAASIASNDASAYNDSTANTDAQNSICPAGWRLPSGGASSTASEFRALNVKYNSGLTNTDEGLIAAPLYLVRGGSVWSQALHYAGYRGGYWSSTVSSSSQAYHLHFDSGWVIPRYSDNRLDGDSVRCLAR